MEDKLKPRKGVLNGDIPCIFMGKGPPLVWIRPFIINEKISKMELKILPAFANEFSVYCLGQIHTKKDTNLEEIAHIYGKAININFQNPVFLMGISTGGSIAQALAIEHPLLIKKLILGATAYKLSPFGKKIQLKYANLLSEGKYRNASSLFFSHVFSNSALFKFLLKIIIWLIEPVFFRPDNPEDLINTLLAEDGFDSKENLNKITVPTLLVGVEKDLFYSEDLIKETAELIPNSELIIYPGLKHSDLEADPRFFNDVISFLNNVPRRTSKKR